MTTSSQTLPDGKTLAEAYRQQKAEALEVRVGGTHSVHSRSGMTIDPRMPTMPGQSTRRVFHRPGRHCLHQARSPMGGGARGLAQMASCILERATGEVGDDFGTLAGTFLQIDGSFSSDELLCVCVCLTRAAVEVALW